MLTRILSVGLLAGLLAGLLVAALQQVTTTPLILVAETYEKQAEAASSSAASSSAASPSAPSSSAPSSSAPSSSAPSSSASTHSHHGPGGHAHDEAGWKPADGFPRFFYTGITTIAAAVGISFLLIAGLVFEGGAIDERRALSWAIAGFVACGLAPAAGLAPELPGSAAGDLVERQIWWAATAAATGLALWLFLRTDHALTRLGAVVLLLAPHIIGAPHPHAFESKMPAELAAQFAALSLAVQALLWSLAGIAIGLLWPRFSPDQTR